MVDDFMRFANQKTGEYLSRILPDLTAFSDSEFADIAVICSPPLWVPVRQRSFQSADPPGAGPKTAVASIDRN